MHLKIWVNSACKESHGEFLGNLAKYHPWIVFQIAMIQLQHPESCKEARFTVKSNATMKMVKEARFTRFQGLEHVEIRTLPACCIHFST